MTNREWVEYLDHCIKHNNKASSRGGAAFKALKHLRAKWEIGLKECAMKLKAYEIVREIVITERRLNDELARIL